MPHCGLLPPLATATGKNHPKTTALGKPQNRRSRHRECCEQLYANKLDILEEMDKFLETYNLQTQNREEKENPNRSITSKIELVIINFPGFEKPRARWFPGEFYQTFKEKSISGRPGGSVD